MQDLYFHILRKLSHPVWGAWIEMLHPRTLNRPKQSHPVWGAWIEIASLCNAGADGLGRTPCGVRGLKYARTIFFIAFFMSHPVWGAWIEIICNQMLELEIRLSHPVWGAWIEISRN